MTMGVRGFSFRADDHSYWINGVRIPSITQCLARAGLVDVTWCTPESRDRGTAVHDLTRQYDLGALDVETCRSSSLAYLLAYLAASKVLRPAWTDIEVALVHPGGWAGRPDRLGLVYDRRSVVEIKSGARATHHAVQTALQAMLAAVEDGLPAEHHQRLAIYLRADGRWSVEQHKDRQDYVVARRVLAQCLGETP